MKNESNFPMQCISALLRLNLLSKYIPVSTSSLTFIRILIFPLLVYDCHIYEFLENNGKTYFTGICRSLLYYIEISKFYFKSFLYILQCLVIQTTFFSFFSLNLSIKPGRSADVLQKSCFESNIHVLAYIIYVLLCYGI